MNEVNICVTTKQPSSPSSVLPPSRPSGRGHRKWTQRVIIDIYGRNGQKSATMQKEEEMDLDYLSDIESDGEEGEDDLFEDPPSPLQGAQPQCAPVPTGPISIPPPLTLSPSCSNFSNFVTPTHSSSSIMRRFSPLGSWEAVASPLSSGYGSAPRFFSSIGTQTPPATPVFLETRIQLQFSTETTPQLPQDSARIGLLRLRQQLLQQDNGRTRFYSEGSDQAAERRGGQSLPDLVTGGAQAPFRGRANSAPTRPSFMEAGRELRRISDEFESAWQPMRRRSFYDLLANLWPGENGGGQPGRGPQRADDQRNPAASGGAA